MVITHINCWTSSFNWEGRIALPSWNWTNNLCVLKLIRYFNFGNDYGLGKCDNSKGNPKQNCIDALQSDLIDMIEIGKAYDALYTINGKPFVMYFVAGFMTTDEWNVRI